MCLALGIAAPGMAAAETIETALAKAYQNNPQLNAQRAIVRQADEGVPQALSGYRPTISANVSIGESIPIPSNRYRRCRLICRMAYRSRLKACRHLARLG